MAWCDRRALNGRRGGTWPIAPTDEMATAAPVLLERVGPVLAGFTGIAPPRKDRRHGARHVSMSI